MSDTLSLVVWNIEFRRLTSVEGEVLHGSIAACEPDIVCITEGHPDFLSLPHRIEAGPDYGYPARGDRRKVLLWSKRPWRNVDAVGDPDLPPGRYVAGITDTPVGEVAVHGICVPWPRAHVETGRRDRSPWEDHLLFLAGLKRLLAGPPPKYPTLLVGDYNQSIPRRRAPRKVFEALLDALPTSFTCATKGRIPVVDQHAIDHVCIAGNLVVDRLMGLSNVGPDGRQLSDHFGLHLVFRRG